MIYIKGLTFIIILKKQKFEPIFLKFSEQTTAISFQK